MMGKQSGLGDRLFIAGVNVSGDISAITGMSNPRETLDSTGIDKSANERLYGKRDATADFTTYFNKAAGAIHQTLKSLPRTDVQVMYLRGAVLGNAAYGTISKQVDYNPTRGDDGALTFTVSTVSNAYGADWCRQVTAGAQTFASAAAGTSIDLLVGTVAFGFQAYIQVFSIGSGTATVTLQGSSDNGVGDAFANITDGGFTAITAAGTQRIQSTSDTASIERYMRVNVTGTFTNLVCAVAVNRNNAQRVI